MQIKEEKIGYHPGKINEIGGIRFHLQRATRAVIAFDDGILTVKGTDAQITAVIEELVSRGLIPAQ